MNEGLLAILIVLATIGAAIWVAIHRDVIYPTPRPANRPRVRVAALRSSGPARPETRTEKAATVSAPVSSAATPESDPEMIAVRVLAKLVAVKLVTETEALENAFDVKAGSSKRYKEVQAKLKVAQAEAESIRAPLR